MRDPSHMIKVEQWARYVKDHPHTWRMQVNPLIDSQIKKANQFYKKLAQTPKGKQTIKKIKQNRAEKTQHKR